MAKKVLVPIATGSEEIETACIVDVLRRANAEVIIASIYSELVVTMSRRMQFVADKLLADCLEEVYDLIVLPGGMPGAEYLRDDARLIALLKKQKQAGKLLAAICAAPAVIFGHHKFDEGGINMTAYPGMEDLFAHAEVLTDGVVVDKNFITSQGPGTALAFAIKLVEMLYDKQKAIAIAKAMLIE